MFSPPRGGCVLIIRVGLCMRRFWISLSKLEIGRDAGRLYGTVYGNHVVFGNRLVLSGIRIARSQGYYCQSIFGFVDHIAGIISCNSDTADKRR